MQQLRANLFLFSDLCVCSLIVWFLQQNWAATSRTSIVPGLSWSHCRHWNACLLLWVLHAEDSVQQRSWPCVHLSVSHISDHERHCAVPATSRETSRWWRGLTYLGTQRPPMKTFFYVCVHETVSWMLIQVFALRVSLLFLYITIAVLSAYALVHWMFWVVTATVTVSNILFSLLIAVSHC